MRDLLLVHGGVDMPSNSSTLGALNAAAMLGWMAAPNAAGAVVAAVGSLESNPLFNAGFGSVLNAEGDVEVDAAVVDGTRSKIGAVAAVHGLRHPIRVAAQLMESGRAVLLTGAGARAYADSVGERWDDLRTDAQVHAWKAFRGGESLSAFTGMRASPSTETVGCIASFADSLVAGTSTGGVCCKAAGRVGDSAIFGAGHWANGRIAVLCSGEGESIIKAQSASSCASQVLSGASVDDAVRWTIESLYRQTRAVGAVVALDRLTGCVSAAHNGTAFPVLLFDGATTQLVEPWRVVGTS